MPASANSENTYSESLGNTRSESPGNMCSEDSGNTCSEGTRTGRPAGAGARIWDAAETLARDRLEALQLERLRATVGRMISGQPFGARRLVAAGVTAPG